MNRQHHKHRHEARFYGKGAILLRIMGKEMVKRREEGKKRRKGCTFRSVSSASLACRHRLVNNGSGQSGHSLLLLAYVA